MTPVTLFLLAHHDDEVFCAAHLRRALADGESVRLLWATAPVCCSCSACRRALVAMCSCAISTPWSTSP